MKKLIRITTVSFSLNGFLKGQLKYLNQYYKVIGVASDDGFLQLVSEREGIRTINLPMERKIKIDKDIKSLIGVIKLIKKEQPYIVHANTPKASLLAMVASWICRVPVRIYTVTGLRFEGLTGMKREILKLMERITCYCASTVIPEGNGVRKTLIQYKITSKPLKVIHNGNINGIDIDYFSPELFTRQANQQLRTKLNINDRDFVFIFVGRLVKDKGINELVSAFLNLRENRCKLLLVGTFENTLDPLSPETLKEIYNNERIIFVGYQNDVRPYFSIADALAFPSYREGFPNVVIQAGAMGLPSIVTDISGSNEIIIDGENGVIIPPKDKDSLQSAIRSFYYNRSEVDRMASNARQLIVDKYEQKAVWRALLKEYKRLEKDRD